MQASFIGLYFSATWRRSNAAECTTTIDEWPIKPNVSLHLLLRSGVESDGSSDRPTCLQSHLDCQILIVPPPPSFNSLAPARSGPERETTGKLGPALPKQKVSA